MKKVLCLLLSMLILLSLAACGGDNGNNDGDDDNKGGSKKPAPSAPAPTEPSIEDLGPWVVTQEIDSRGDRFVYKYNEQGELISYEAFDGTKKYRDYNVSYLATDSGGKVMVIESKHVRDSEFEKSYEAEYNAKGDIIRYSYYYRDKVTSEYTFTYDAEGCLSSYVYSYEGMLGNACTRVVNYTFRDGLLRNVEQTTQLEDQEPKREYAYAYDYDDEGILEKIQYVRGDEEGAIELEKEIRHTTASLRLAEGCDHYVPMQTLFSSMKELDENGNPSKIELTLNSWGFPQNYAFPYVLFGMANSGNWDNCIGKVTFTRLDIYLAERETSK